MGCPVWRSGSRTRVAGPVGGCCAATRVPAMPAPAAGRRRREHRPLGIVGQHGVGLVAHRPGAVAQGTLARRGWYRLTTVASRGLSPLAGKGLVKLPRRMDVLDGGLHDHQRDLAGRQQCCGDVHAHPRGVDDRPEIAMRQTWSRREVLGRTAAAIRTRRVAGLSRTPRCALNATAPLLTRPSSNWLVRASRSPMPYAPLSPRYVPSEPYDQSMSTISTPGAAAATNSSARLIASVVAPHPPAAEKTVTTLPDAEAAGGRSQPVDARPQRGGDLALGQHLPRADLHGLHDQVLPHLAAEQDEFRQRELGDDTLQLADRKLRLRVDVHDHTEARLVGHPPPKQCQVRAYRLERQFGDPLSAAATLCATSRSAVTVNTSRF